MKRAVGTNFAAELTTMRPSPSLAAPVGHRSCPAPLPVLLMVHVSPVPIPQHLHAMIEAISYNKVTRVIKGNAPGIRELTCTRTLAADGAHM
jgi:hypothetical protein